MTLTARIIKGGALLEDSRRFVEAWDPQLDKQANLARIQERNLLGKASSSRLEEVTAILRRRLLSDDGHVVATLRHLAPYPGAFRDACYYEAAREDELLARFASELLLPRWRSRRLAISPEEVSTWVEDQRPDWGIATRKRVAEGLLSAGRDFGLLEGAARKSIMGPSITLMGFAYVARREHGCRGSSLALLESPVWASFLLEPPEVDALFREADRRKLLRFLEAGSTVRIDWLIGDLSEVVRVPVG